MAATDTQLEDAARDALKRIIDSDAQMISENGRTVQHMNPRDLLDALQKLQSKKNASSRRVFVPMRRVDA